MALAASPLRMLVEQNRVEILALVQRHKGRTVAVFGSVVRGEERPDSDIDFLVEFERSSSLLDVAGLELDLEALLGCHVDVVSVGALLDRDDDIRRDAVPL